MRTLIRKLIHAATIWIPSKIKWELAKVFVRDAAFMKSYGFELIALVAPRKNIDAIRTQGTYGEILSSPTDLSVFPAYADSGTWAAHTNEVVRGFFASNGPGTYIDIGANIGLTTIPIAQMPGMRCIAFEPEPTNFANLRANIERNCPAGSVQLHRVALFERETELTFELAERNLGDHRLRVSESFAGTLGEADRRIIKVKAAALDTIVTDVRQPLVVKIDTQGAEPFVFSGGRQTLSQAHVILFEWCPYLMARLGGDSATVIDFIAAHFTHGEVAVGEAESGGERMSIANICTRLSTFATTETASDYRKYLDVIVEKRP